MAALTAASTATYNAGSQTKYAFTFTSVDADDTFASGLSGVQEFMAVMTADPVTNSSAGVAVSESAGTFTFYPGVESKAVTLMVWAGGAR